MIEWKKNHQCYKERTSSPVTICDMRLATDHKDIATIFIRSSYSSDVNKNKYQVSNRPTDRPNRKTIPFLNFIMFEWTLKCVQMLNKDFEWEK